MDGEDGVDARIVVTDIAPGATCAAGGKRIEVGLDEDASGALEAAEVAQSEVVCAGVDGQAGADGLGSLIVLSDEPVGSNCADGGKRIEAGIDADASGTLDPPEVSDVEYACNGATGTTGSNGTDGADAVPTLVSSVTEAAGTNCASGGQRISFGPDDDDDGVLDAGEVDGVHYVCNGASGANGSDGFSSLVSVVDEAAGANCAMGGERVTYGLDDDRDGALDAGEVDGTRYVCDGAAGAAGTSGTNGLSSLVSVVNEAAGANCANGGERITYGLDDDGDSTLDAGEVDGTRYVCDGATGAAGTNGTNGLNSLVSVVNEAAGANCANGGERITYGLDDDGDSTLDPGEVDGTRYVCDGINGTNGSNGANGLTSLVTVTAEAAGANCAGGGQRIQTGLDDDGNGSLAAGEVDATSYVCNGQG